MDASCDVPDATQQACRLTLAGDSALLVEFANRIDPAVNARAIGLASRLEAARLHGVRDVIVTYRAVAVCFDPLGTDPDRLARDVVALVDRVPAETDSTGPIVEIPVCYGGALGPDLEDVAVFAGCSPDEVVRVHAGAVYRVYMLGFVPGFSYLASVEPRIAMPRRTTPRVRVPAGSVGIAGHQTGIYPSDAPGGWRLIGHTTMRPFDLTRRDPFLLRPGDRVRFVPVSAEAAATGQGEAST